MHIGKNTKEDYIRRQVLPGRTQPKVTLPRVLFFSLFNRGFRAVLLYRIGRYFRVHGRNLLAAFVERLIHRLCFCEISTTADIGPGFCVFHPFGLVVGGDVRAGKNFTLSMDVVLGGNIGKQRPDGSQMPILGDNVNIAAGCKVVGPVKIGDNCLIGANSVVIHDIPSDCIAAGAPARVIRIGGQRVKLLKQQGELSKTLGNFAERLEKLEKKLGRESKQ